MEKKSEAWKAWKAFWSWIWNALWYAADLWEAWVKWVIKWTVDTASMAWDALSKATDFVTWWMTNFDASEWWIDKMQDKTHKALDENNIIDSEWGKTWAWKAWLWVAEFAWEVFTPWLWILWALWKWAKVWLKWLKISKEWINTIKNAPKAAKALEELANTAAKAWTKIEQSQVDDIIKMYWKWAIEKAWAKISEWKVSSKLKSVLNKISKYTPEQLAEAEKINPTLIQKLKKLWKIGAVWTIAQWVSDNSWISLPEEDSNENKDIDIKKDLEEADISLSENEWDNKEWYVEWVDYEVNKNDKENIPTKEWHKTKMWTQKVLDSFKELNKENEWWVTLPPMENEKAIDDSINEIVSNKLWKDKSNLSKEQRMTIAKQLEFSNYTDSEEDKMKLYELLNNY